MAVVLRCLGGAYFLPSKRGLYLIFLAIRDNDFFYFLVIIRENIYLVDRKNFKIDLFEGICTCVLTIVLVKKGVFWTFKNNYGVV